MKVNVGKGDKMSNLVCDVNIYYENKETGEVLRCKGNATHLVDYYEYRDYITVIGPDGFITTRRVRRSIPCCGNCLLSLRSVMMEDIPVISKATEIK